MSDVLAALDESPTADLVLRTARRLARATGGCCRAVHVRSEEWTDLPRLADLDTTELTAVGGDPATEIGRAADDPDVGFVVVGARSDPEGPTPAGHVAIAVVEAARKPVVVVAPDSGRGLGSLDRVLIPLEGSSETSTPIGDVVAQLGEAGATPIALHVFDVGTVPQFWDDLAHSGPCYAAGFGSRWWPGDQPVDVLLQRGDPASTILEVADREHVDLIVLGWAQDLGPGRAEVVRAALARAHVPVLLVPVMRDGEDPPPGADRRHD